MRPLLLAALLAVPTTVASAHDALCPGCGGGYDAAPRATEITAVRVPRHGHAAYGSPSTQRWIRAEIDYSEARLRELHAQQRRYRSVNAFGTGNALALSAQQLRLELRREELILRDLREQLIATQREARELKRLYGIRAQRVTAYATQRAKVGDGSITIVNH